jgi:hypothetical protein
MRRLVLLLAAISLASSISACKRVEMFPQNHSIGVKTFYSDGKGRVRGQCFKFRNKKELEEASFGVANEEKLWRCIVLEEKEPPELE